MDPSLLEAIRKEHNLPGTPIYLLNCPKCPLDSEVNSIPRITIKEHPVHHWARTLSCIQCKLQWYICAECVNVRHHFIEARQLSNHHQKRKILKIGCHCISMPMILEPSNDGGMNEPDDDLIGAGDVLVPGDDDFPNIPIMETVEGVLQSLPPEEPVWYQRFPPEAFDRVASRHFFECNPSTGMCGYGGFDRIIAQSQTGLAYPPVGVVSQIDRDIYWDTTIICNLSSRDIRSCLGRLLGNVAQQTLRNYHMKSQGNEGWAPSCPLSPQEIRSQIVEGRYSIFKNLPHPKIHQFGPDLVGVSLIECIQDLLAFGFPTADITQCAAGGSVNCSEQSARAQEAWRVAQETHESDPVDVVILILEWQDDFEPLHTKKNRGSVTVKTVTFFCPSRSVHRNSICYTYPLCFAKDKKALDAYEHFYNRDLIRLSSAPAVQMYSQEHGRMVKVHATLFVSLMDQIAKRPCCGLLAGNSRFHARFGYSHDYSDNLECTSWGIDTEDKLDFASLKQSTNIVLQSLMDGEIDKPTAKEDMHRSCLSEETQSSLLDHVDNCIFVKELLDDSRPSNPEDYPELLKEYGNGTLPWPHPPVWDRPNFDINHFLDAIMHLLFLGLTKLVMRVCRIWLTKNRKASSFEEDFSKGLHKPIMALNLSWIKPYEYSQSGGKVCYLFHQVAQRTAFPP